MITDNDTLEVYGMISRVLGRQGVEVEISIVDGQHQCRLKFDGRLLFEGDSIGKLSYMFYRWCDNESENAVGKRMVIF